MRQSAANSEALMAELEVNTQYRTAFDLLKYGVAEPPVPGYDFVRDMIEAEMAAIVDGAPVQATLDAANEEANAILTDQMADMN